MNYLAQNLKYLRQRFNKNQSELAFEVDKGQTTVGNWENGVSEPNITELIVISNFFGINIHSLITVELSKGNLITDEHVRKWGAKGKLKGKLIGNLNHEIIKNYGIDDQALNVVNDRDQDALWLVFQQLKLLSLNIDGLREALSKGV